MILVTFAVPFESVTFRSRMGKSSPYVQVLHTGVGSQAAEHAIRSSLDTGRYSQVVISGFAGGLSDDLAVGDLITTIEGDSKKHAAVGLAKTVRLIESDHILDDPAGKRAFAASTGAEAVDMESTTILKECVQRGVPVTVLRVISDDARSSLVVPPAILSDAARRPIIGTIRLLAHLAVRPGKWGPFRLMVSNCRRAQLVLGVALANLVKALDQS